MSPRSRFGRKLSMLTLNLLRNTGWYLINMNMAQTIHWGSKKGCSFLMYHCKKQDKFEEFCSLSEMSNEELNGCRYDLLGRGKCSKDSYSGDCLWISAWTNRICTNPHHMPEYGNKTLEIYGSQNSACIKSSVKTHDYNTEIHTRCYEMYCKNSDTIEIIIGSKVNECKKSDKGNGKSLA